MNFDITKLPESIRYLLLFSIQLPLWYVFIYLVVPSIYNSNDIILKSSVCFAFTIMSAITSTFSNYATSKTFRSIYDNGIIVISASMSTVLLPLLLLITYLIEIFVSLNFILYLIIYNLLIIIYSIITRDRTV